MRAAGGDDPAEVEEAIRHVLTQCPDRGRFHREVQARWTNESAEFQAGLIQIEVRNWPTRGVPEGRVAGLVAVKLRQDGHREPWHEEFAHDAGRKYLRSKLLALESAGRVQQITGPDAEYETLCDGTVRDEPAWCWLGEVTPLLEKLESGKAAASGTEAELAESVQVPEYKPTAAEIRKYAEHFQRLAGRIEEAKRAGAAPQNLWRELCRTYPAEAGRLFCVCLCDDCFPDWHGFLHGVRELQWRGHVRLPDVGAIIDSHMDRVVPLVKLVIATNDSEVPNCSAECAALYSIIWFSVVRGWLALRQPARFRIDLFDAFHPWVHNVQHEMLLGTGEWADVSTQAAGMLEWRTRPDGAPDPLILQAHADIQAEACRAIAYELDVRAQEAEQCVQESVALGARATAEPAQMADETPLQAMTEATTLPPERCRPTAEHRSDAARDVQCALLDNNSDSRHGASDETYDEIEIAILVALVKLHPERLSVEKLYDNTVPRYDRKTIGGRLPHLQKGGLIERPGRKTGITVTPRGLELVRRVRPQDVSENAPQ